MRLTTLRNLALVLQLANSFLSSATRSLGAGDIGSVSKPLACLSDINEDTPILQYGDDRLRLPSRSVNIDDVRNMSPNSELYKIRQDLHATLSNFRRKHGFGRAIAAPQIGQNIRMIAMKLSDMEPAVTLYNPEIIERSAECVTLWDDCFSFPDIMVRVSRHASVCVTFHDDIGVQKTWNCTEIALSELLQHEIDHLNGVLSIDRALPNADNCTSVIERSAWIENKREFNKFVNYFVDSNSDGE